MSRRTLIAGVITLALLAGGAGLVLANGDDDAPLAGTDLERASQAALEHTGGGKVIETEAGDDGAAYGVEIRLDDDSVVEVQLDETFNVTGQEADDDGSGGEDEATDD